MRRGNAIPACDATDLVLAADLSTNQLSFCATAPSLSQFVDGDDECEIPAESSLKFCRLLADT